MSYPPLSQLPHAGEILVEAADILDSLGHPWWLGSGTALGFARENGFIPHDTDLDFEMVGEPDSPVLEEVRRAFESKGFAQLRYMSFQRALIKRGVIVDVYFWYQRDLELLCDTEWGRMRQPAHLFDNLLMWDFEGRKYPMPNPPEEYCRMRYGDDWRTPKPAKVSGHLDAANIELW